jgi:hypothetical protein
MWGVVIALGGLWVVGRISRGFSSHPLNQSGARRFTAYAPDVQSELMDSSSVSDETAQEPGAFVLGEPDDAPPPQFSAIEGATHTTAPSLAPQRSCCSGHTASEISIARRVPVAGRAPGARAPVSAPVRLPIAPAPTARQTIASRLDPNSFFGKMFR